MRDPRTKEQIAAGMTQDEYIEWYKKQIRLGKNREPETAPADPKVTIESIKIGSTSPKKTSAKGD